MSKQDQDILEAIRRLTARPNRSDVPCDVIVFAGLRAVATESRAIGWGEKAFLELASEAYRRAAAES